MSRYQIGSEVLDFGESPVAWPGPLKSKLYKIPSKRALSWLGFSDAYNQSEATPSPTHQKSGPQPMTSKRGETFDASPIMHKAEALTSTHLASRARNDLVADIEHIKGNNKTAGRSVFSLFGIDRTLDSAQDENTPLRDIASTFDQLRINAEAMRVAQIESCKQEVGSSQDLPAWIQTKDGPRSISLSKYLDEISKVGANGARHHAQENVENHR